MEIVKEGLKLFNSPLKVFAVGFLLVVGNGLACLYVAVDFIKTTSSSSNIIVTQESRIMAIEKRLSGMEDKTAKLASLSYQRFNRAEVQMAEVKEDLKELKADIRMLLLKSSGIPKVVHKKSDHLQTTTNIN